MRFDLPWLLDSFEKEKELSVCFSCDSTEQKFREMTSSSNLRQGRVLIDKVFETTNREFKVQGRKYQVLPNFGICYRELGGLKVARFCACMRSFCSVV